MIDIHGNINEDLHIRWWGTDVLPPSVADWKPVLIALDEMFFDFYERTNDLAWWYTERPLISMLAGAVWKSDGVAFEEFYGKKDHGGGSYRGRFDGLFCLQHRTFVAEAKHHFMALRGRTPSKVVEAVAGEARDDADALKVYKGHNYHMPIVFTSPHCPVSQKSKLNDLVQEHRSRDYTNARNTLSTRGGFRVDLFPSIDRYDAFTGGFKTKRYIYPGLTIHMGVLDTGG